MIHKSGTDQMVIRETFKIFKSGVKKKYQAYKEIYFLHNITINSQKKKPKKE